jgi:hypothetical protein
MPKLSAFSPVQNPKLSVADIVSLVPAKLILVSTFLLLVVDSKHLVQGSAVLVVAFDFLIHDFSVPNYTNFQPDHKVGDPAHCLLDLVHALRRLDDPRL